MGHAKNLLTTTIILLSCLLPISGQVDSLAKGPVKVSFPTGFQKNGRLALGLAKEAIPRIAERLALPIPKKTHIILARQADQIPPELEPAIPQWAAGVAFPFRQTVVIRLDRLQALTGGNFKIVLEHELVHLVMGGVGERNFKKLPWWFHEGVAQVISSHTFFIKEADLSDLVTNKRIRSLNRLGRHEDLTSRGTDLDYQEAHSFTLFLENRLGEGIMAEILEASREKEDFNLAFLAVTGFSYVTIEEQWKELLRAGPLATIQKLTRDFFWVLLILALPLIWFALKRRRRRDQEIEKSWEDETKPEVQDIE